jgi:hypothetical protein
MPGPSVLTLIRNRAFVSWLILVVATAISFAVGAEHSTGSPVVLVVLTIAVRGVLRGALGGAVRYLPMGVVANSN